MDLTRGQKHVVVDDRAVNRLIMRKMLQRCIETPLSLLDEFVAPSIDVDEASRVEEAVELVRRRPGEIDIVWLDVRMVPARDPACVADLERIGVRRKGEPPVRGGLETAALLRRVVGYEGRIYGVTGDDSDALRGQALAFPFEFDEVFVKPVSPATVSACVQRVEQSRWNAGRREQ